MTVKPRTALYHVLGKTKFLLTAIFMTVALLISIVSNSFTELLYFMPDLKLWMMYIPAAIMNLLAIAGIWVLYIGAKAKNPKVLRTGFSLLAVYAIILCATALNFLVFLLIDSVSYMLMETEETLVLGELTYDVTFIPVFLFCIFSFALYSRSLSNFSIAAKYNKNVATLPLVVTIPLILTSFSVAVFWNYGEYILDPSVLVIGLKLASFIFILLLSLEYKRLCPIMSRRERAEFRNLIKNPETRAKILEEAEIEGDPVPRVEKNTVSAPTASATQGAWDSNLARLRALACVPFENGADYSESDRFSVIYRAPFEPVAREPLSITELSVIDDLLSGRRLLRIKAKNNSPVAVRSASFRLVLADRSGSTIGEMHLPSIAVNLLGASCEGFDNYAFILPDETTFGVACITRVDLADGLYWDKGTEFYRFMTVSAPSAECAPDPAATPSEGDEQRTDVPVNDPAPEESN